MHHIINENNIDLYTLETTNTQHPLFLPASDIEIQKAEEGIRYEIPPILKEFAMNFSKKIDFEFFCVKDDIIDNLDGEADLGSHSLDFSIYAEDFEDLLDDEYFKDVLINKIGVIGTCGGDCILVDTPDENKDKVYYYNHETNETKFVADNIIQFMVRLSQMGFVDPEALSKVFYSGSLFTDGYFDPKCEEAKKYRELLGIKDSDLTW